MPKKAVMLALALLSVACSKRHSNPNSEISRFTPEGSLKPAVAIVPVIDNSHSNLPWSVSEEFTTAINRKIAKKNKLFLAEESEIKAITHKLKESHNPFGSDYNWVKTSFRDKQFVVFLELIEHKEELLSKENKSGPAELNMTMRVRVFDLRDDNPKVILQEIVHESHYIPKFFTRNMTFQPNWNEDGFNISPMGMAHSEFSLHLAKRIQHYISIQNRG